MTLIFPDLSHWNAEPSAYNTIPAVMLKASEGTNYADPVFQVRRQRFQTAGTLVGAYHFLNGEDASKQAAWFLKTVSPDARTAMAVDFESSAATLDMLLAFGEYVYKYTGVRLLIYTRASLLLSATPAQLATLSQYKLWLAAQGNSPAIPAPWSYAALQQFQIGTLPGFSTKIDLNRFEGTLDDLRAFWSSIGGKPTPLPLPKKMLNVPYISQEGPGARKYRNECGVPCVLMMQWWQADTLGLPRLAVTVDQLADQTTLARSDVGLATAELVQLAARNGLSLKLTTINQTGIQGQIDAWQPVLCLISYAPILERENHADAAGHFVVAIGYDADRVYLNDPDWWDAGSYKASMGAGFAVPWAQFNTAMSKAPVPNQACIISKIFKPSALRVIYKLGMNVRRDPSAAADKVGDLAFNASVIVDLDQQTSDAQGNVFVPIWGGGFVALKNPAKNATYLSADPPIVVVPDAALRGYGAQVLGNAFDDNLASRPVFKSVDNPGAVERYHALNSGGATWYRAYDQAADNPSAYIVVHGGVQPGVAAWMNKNRAVMQQIKYAYHEGPCEAAPTPDLVAFETERCQQMFAEGFKGCFLNLGVGQTSDEFWKRDDVQKLVALIVQTGGCIGLHCYGEGIISSNSGDHYWKADGSWSVPGDPLPRIITPEQSLLALRIVRDKQVVNSLGLYPQFAATELGCDDCAPSVFMPHGLKTRGWKDCVGIWQAEGWLAGTSGGEFYKKTLQWWCDITKLPGLVYAFNDRTRGNVNTNEGVFDIQGLF